MLKSAIVILACLVFASLVGGADSASSEMPILEAQKFVVRNSIGKEVAALEATSDGPTFRMLDSKGNARVILTARDDGPSLIMLDKAQVPRIMVCEKSDTWIIGFTDAKRRVQIGLGAGDKRTPEIVIYDHDEKVVWSSRSASQK